MIKFVIPYVLLISFFNGEFKDLTEERINIINAMPYDGIAVMLEDAYETRKSEMVTDKIRSIVKNTRNKNIWPWIFLNRMVGYRRMSAANSLKADNEYFRKIKGMDLYNENGSLDDFMAIWRKSLKLAKDFGSPGIVVDLEPYNNYNAYEISFLAGAHDKTSEEIIERLERIGVELAEITANTYPNAIIWILFTGIGSKKKTINPFDQEDYRSISYIVKGMLERAREHDMSFTVISGGELSIGYCNESVKSLRLKMNTRKAAFEEFNGKFAHLKMGGPIAIWNDARKKTRWMLKGECLASDEKELKDFEPYFSHLASVYDYIWVYAAEAAKFNPFNTSEKDNRTLLKIINGIKK